MKKLITIFPVILVLLITCIPLSSVAVEITEDNAEVFAPPEDYKTESWPDASGKFRNSEHYFFVYYKINDRNHIFYLSDIDNYFDYVSVEETETTVTISFDIPSGTSSPHWYDRYDWPDGFRTNQSDFDTYDSAPLIYDKVNKTLTWHSVSRSFDNLPVLKFETDLIDQSDAGLEVSFLPINFTGTIGESYKIGDTTAQLFQIDMEVTNNTGRNYQFLWTIVPHGESLSFPDNNVDCQTKGFVGSPSWIYTTNEWCVTVNPDAFVSGSSWGSSSDGHVPIQTTYLPCAWHWSPSHSTNSFQACIKNMKLLKGKTYDCLVYAVPTGSDKLTLLDFYNFGNRETEDTLGFSTSETIIYSSVECIYSSTFTMDFNTPFDKNYNAAGVLSFDPDSDMDDFFTNSSARYNPDTHELEIGYNIGNHNHTNGSYGSFSGADIGTFTGAIQNVFGFISAFFNYLPFSFQQLYFFGFTALIVVCIVKAVKGS